MRKTLEIAELLSRFPIDSTITFHRYCATIRRNDRIIAFLYEDSESDEIYCDLNDGVKIR